MARMEATQRNYQRRVKHKVTTKKVHEADFVLLTLTLILVLFGLLMVYSASSYENITQGFKAYSNVMKQGIFAIIGLFTMIFIVSNIDYHNYTFSLTKLFLLLTLVLNVAVILFEPTKGASRWIKLGGLSLQPSELAKFMLVLYAAHSLKRMGIRNRRPGAPVFKVFFITGIFSLIIIVLQSNLSVGAIIFLTALFMVFLSGAKLWHVMIPVLMGAGGLGLAVFLEPYRMERLFNFIDPFKTAQGSGHQLVQSLFALTSGGLFGRGIGMSRMKAFWLPEAHNDFIFSVVVEELGLIGGLVLMLLMIFLVLRGIKIAMEAKDQFGRLLAVGITAVFALQSLINMAVVIGAFPVTGVPLPFISAGGTSLFVNLCAVGILLNISKQSDKKSKEYQRLTIKEKA